ncbi:cytochrome P450 2J2-like [Rhinatrema bivittatum]|uniref:cytochrome P450 2J2-like n=1 Tax=Rhinatrema bivittatum TaxID=194408 RepID=UPI00112EF129|nr:cytochrome P450 2J2-like [Rhinatrema bivittatum]
MLALSEFLVALILFFLIAHFLKLQWAGRRLPPGPTPLPVIGNLWLLNFHIHHDQFIQLAKTYGNVFTVWLGQRPVIVLNGYRTVKDALVSHSEELTGRPTFPLQLATSGSKGIITSNGHIWKQQRRFGLMTLRNLGLGKRSLEERIQEEAQQLVEVFSAERGRPIDPLPFIVNAVANVICSVVFGHRFSIDDDVFHQLIEATAFLINARKHAWSRIYDLFPWLMERIPGPHKMLFHHWKQLRSYIKQEIRSHREHMTSEPQDLIDFYLNQISKTKGDPFSTYDEENMIQVVHDLFLAGSETTTTTLRWAVLYMVKYPEIQEKVQKELDAVLGSSHIICYEDRKRLPYTNAVIHEVQRYGNIVPVGVPRLCVKQTTLQEFPINKGTIVLPNLSSVLYDPEHWETPRRFNPSHFLDKEGNFVSKEAFIPFSAGQRVCLGEQLARTELFIFFTNLFRAFTFQLPAGTTRINSDIIVAATIQPHPYKICAIQRL